jgi:hypothetical protein
VPAVIAVAFWHPAGQSHIVYEGWSRKLEWLFGIFYNYDPLLDFGCFFLLLALLGTFAVFRRLNVAPRLVPAILLVLLAYLLLPTEMFGAWATDQRVILAFFLLLVAGTAPHFPSRRTAVLTGTAVVIVLLVRLGVVEAVWLKADPIYRADLAGLDMLPHGAKLAVAYPESALGTEQIPEVHVPTLAAARRNAFVPTLFTFPGQQPIVFRPPYDRLAAEAFQFTLWAAFMGGDDEARRQTLASLAGYDAIVFVNHEPFQAAARGLPQAAVPAADLSDLHAPARRRLPRTAIGARRARSFVASRRDIGEPEANSLPQPAPEVSHEDHRDPHRACGITSR